MQCISGHCYRRLCVGYDCDLRKKMAEMIKMRFLGADPRGSKKPLLNGDQIPPAGRGMYPDTSLTVDASCRYDYCSNLFMLSACPTHCQECSSTGGEITCNMESCDPDYGLSVEGKCKGDWLHSITSFIISSVGYLPRQKYLCQGSGENGKNSGKNGKKLLSSYIISSCRCHSASQQQ